MERYFPKLKYDQKLFVVQKGIKRTLMMMSTNVTELLNHYIVHLKLTERCMPTILEFKYKQNYLQSCHLPKVTGAPFNSSD